MLKSSSRLEREESESNSELQVRNHKEIEAENRRIQNTANLQGCEIFATCRISQVAKFRNLLLCPV